MHDARRSFLNLVEGCIIDRMTKRPNRAKRSSSAEVPAVNGWTPERRARQAALIRTWQPWRASTGPRTDEGKARTARNGFKGGHCVALRELTKQLNEVLREQRNYLRRR
jgi:hypothetical protein